MTVNPNYFDNYFEGLTAILESSFPRTCSLCGKRYETAERFLTETHNMPQGRSSLKEALEEDGTAIVEVFRNCSCGSTLMDEFNSRRNYSALGKKRRVQFDKLLHFLQKKEIPTEKARLEILKVFNGEHSELLDSFLKNNH